ncbi:hypothetical protein [Embleya sp. NPDC020630]|uniref:hypothetical protein n=1 Tax=Embleya sp. NPDC020630 TaxID=3363979 RepID=UPI00378F3EBF
MPTMPHPGREAERLGTPGRLRDKDASDVLQVMIASDPGDVAARAARILEHGDSATAAAAGLAHLRALFGAPRSVGVDMAARALAGAMPEARLRATAVAFTAALPIG